MTDEKTTNDDKIVKEGNDEFIDVLTNNPIDVKEQVDSLIESRKDRLWFLRGRVNEVVADLQHALSENFNDDKTKTEAEEKLKEIERKVEHEVLWDAGEDGKPKYSNKEKRDNEVAGRLQANKTYQDLRELQRRMADRVSKRRDDIDVLKYRFRAAEAQIRIEELLSGGLR